LKKKVIMQLALNKSVGSRTINHFLKFSKFHLQNITHGDYKNPVLKTSFGNFSSPLAILDVLVTSADHQNLIYRESDFETAQIFQYCRFSLTNGDSMDILKHVNYLNSTIEPNTFFVGNSVSLADLFLYTSLEPHIKVLLKDALCISLLRWWDFISHLVNPTQTGEGSKTSIFAKLELPKFEPIKILTKADSSSTSQQQKSQQQPQQQLLQQSKKQQQQQQTASSDGGVDSGLISIADIRVGHVLSCKKHENADRLYVEEIDVGEGKPRTVCSGLVQHMPPENIQNKKVLLFCNLKPKNAVGIESNGMVLCATNQIDGRIELLIIPDDAIIGERVQFGDVVGKPDPQLNEKKLKHILEGLKTNDEGTVVFGRENKVATLKAGGICKASFKNSKVS